MPVDAPIPAIATEKQWQKQVVELAHLYGWTVAHFRQALNAKGDWMTPTVADAAGFPDLVLVKHGQLVFAELKGEKGRLKPRQKMWLALLDSVPGIDVYVWKPSELDEVQTRLAQ